MMQGKSMYANKPFVQANGRRHFDKEEYKSFDEAGKKFACALLFWLKDNQPEILKTLFGNYKNITFETVENKQYGDIHIIADSYKNLCEIEARREEHFKGNFYKTGTYQSGINIPQKQNIKNSNGIFLSLNGDDAIDFLTSNTIPDSFIIIKTEDILECNILPPQTRNGEIDPKNNDDKYKVPHSKAMKFAWDGEKYARY
jgi:hypothetical protein